MLNKNLFSKEYLDRIENDQKFQNFLKHTEVKSMKELDIEMYNMFRETSKDVPPFDDKIVRVGRYKEWRERKGLADQDPDRFRDTVILDKINIW